MEPHKRAELEAHEQFLAGHHPNWYKPFGAAWPEDYWLKWATIAYAFRTLGIAAGSTVLDAGSGPGWTSLFLAESGYRVTGLDIAPAAIEMASRRATRWGLDIAWEVADVEDPAQGTAQFDAILVFDALHHSTRPRRTIRSLTDRLRPGGWILFGEPSWLHSISPGARRASRELGWTERGVLVSRLRAQCRAAGLVEARRFFEPTHPYATRGPGFGWQLVRLVAANVSAAPRASVWLAARRPPAPAPGR